MGKVLIWFVIIISTVVLYCLMKVKAESDELYEELMRKHFYGRSDDIPASDKTEHLKGCGKLYEILQNNNADNTEKE